MLCSVLNDPDEGDSVLLKAINAYFESRSYEGVAYISDDEDGHYLGKLFIRFRGEFFDSDTMSMHDCAVRIDEVLLLNEERYAECP